MIGRILRGAAFEALLALADLLDLLHTRIMAGRVREWAGRVG
jgi:hypothetical protein